MKKVNINISLEPDDIIDIYVDYQEETKYEGKAVLLERVKRGDSFYLFEEKLALDEKKTYTEEELLKISKLKKLNYLFKGRGDIPPEKTLSQLYDKLIKNRKDKLDDFKRMEAILSKYRNKHSASVYKIGTLLKEYDDNYIIRFIQQDRSLWRPSIFSYERWKVRFIKDNYNWDVDFTTNRNIRILKCINPSEGVRRSELTEHTTYDSIPSIRYSRIRHKKNWWIKQNNKSKENEESLSEDDLDELIINKLKNIK